jgi:flagellin-like protein
MFDTDTEAQERGQVGIGTLIVFIALVLVAAIAAGVLINTAGFLQSQAEATGEESTAQVANNLDVALATGQTAVDDGSYGVTGIAIDIQLAPGSEPIDLTSSTIEVYPEGQSRASITPASGDITGNAVLESGDTSTYAFPDNSIFGTFGAGPTNGLPAGTSADIVIITPDGSQTTATISASGTITTGGEDVILN